MIIYKYILERDGCRAVLLSRRPLSLVCDSCFARCQALRRFAPGPTSPPSRARGFLHPAHAWAVRGRCIPLAKEIGVMGRSSHQGQKDKAIAEMLAMIADTHPVSASQHPRLGRELDEWLWEDATEFCAALEFYAAHSGRPHRTSNCWSKLPSFLRKAKNIQPQNNLPPNCEGWWLPRNTPAPNAVSLHGVGQHQKGSKPGCRD
jgi:hypothetical protein